MKLIISYIGELYVYHTDVILLSIRFARLYRSVIPEWDIDIMCIN